MRHHVVLVEDDALVRTLMARRMEMADWRVTALRDGRGLEAIIASDPPSLLVVDLGLPYIDGLALVETLRASGIDIPVLVTSAFELPHLYHTVTRSGANDLLQKPFDQDDMIDRMRRLMAA
jgi:DNA-binding response OmpR family regulator